mgnify:FL=1
MYNKYYAFGGVTLELTGDTPWQASDLCRAFQVEPRPAEHTIRVTVGGDMPQPPEGAAHEATLYRWREGERFCLLQDYGSRYRAFAARQGGLTEVRLSEGYRETASDRVILESAGLFDLLADFGMLILHSAYIVTPQGQGLLFSGPSGAGKSTQAELWRQYAGAQVINGDRSLVRPGDGTVHGILYSGTSGICRNVSAPLRAIVLPVQGTENRVYPLRPKEAFMALVNQCAYYPWAADSAARMTELAAALIGAVPVYGLTCRKDEGAVRALEDYLRRA